jgi:cytochrome c-type protein NapC
MPTSLVISLITACALLVLLVAFRPESTRSREGKILAFLGLAILPGVAISQGFSAHMERAQSIEFCLSCHVMSDYGRSLYIDDPSYLPAKHFQNNLVPRDKACYTCHAEYGMFGDVKAKIAGLQHLRVQYLGTIPKPADIKLYQPFNNNQCLKCHLGSRQFEEGSAHDKTPELLSQIKSGQRSCLSSGCHEFVHDVGSLGEVTFWKEKQTDATQH